MEGLYYSDQYRCWEGRISIRRFDDEKFSLRCFVDSTNPLTEADHHTLIYVEEHFADIYENILRTLFEWQQSEGMTWEVFDEEKLTFDRIRFDSKEDIHPLLGEPLLEIIPGNEKENQSYYCIRFDHCLLSIEHGLDALCHKSDVIEIEACEITSLLETLSYFEPDCTRWKKDFWK
ncbi:hypothetical protein [Neobacillus rhizophilus]|uniref:Uncharacterized protein n=1 Tax=Neobacillus rhizophilus TaxID=2833579 RepID=A0A942YSM3_9BACI|nr:hypothetical protein [Neobacillus rhizophilus]MBS4211289.1 hypothetical protein [Neobacillus rhizophilus]MBU8918811.1 hypothetical protein [Bacillus sp. FJAT-29953]